MSSQGGSQAEEKAAEPSNSQSTTSTTTINGQHEHTIVGYSLIKGIGDGEPIASERFTVGGHEWVLLFYPDGKRSSSSEPIQPPPPRAPLGGNMGGGGMNHGNMGGANGVHGMPQQGMPANQPAGGGQQPAGMHIGDGLHFIPMHEGDVGEGMYGNHMQQQGHQGHQQQHHQHQQQPQQPPQQQQQHQPPPQPIPQPPQQHPPQPQQPQNDYAALFVALIGEGPNPQGVVNTYEGKVVRAFHRFTLVDQCPKEGEAPRHMTKGRRRDQGAVKISCARQDPNARNCHGYRKFVKRSVLESTNNGYLKDDTIVIRYAIELVVSSGGALSKPATAPPGPAPAVSPSAISVPPPSLGQNLAMLLEKSEATDVVFKVESEVFRAHRIILGTRSPVFRALLSGGMKEDEEGEVNVVDVRPPVFKALLYFVYADALPEEHEGPNLDVHMAQHLLVAADQFALTRLRAICEQRLCETVDEGSVATTLTLAEQNHASELKRVCLEFISSSEKLAEVMASEGFKHMVASCPHLQVEILQQIADRRRFPQLVSSHGHAMLHGPTPLHRPGHDIQSAPGMRGHVRARDLVEHVVLGGEDGGVRRVRQRRE